MLSLIQAVEWLFQYCFALSFWKFDGNFDDSDKVKKIVNHPNENPLPKFSLCLDHQENEASNWKVPDNDLYKEEGRQKLNVDFGINETECEVCNIAIIEHKIWICSSFFLEFLRLVLPIARVTHSLVYILHRLL